MTKPRPASVEGRTTVRSSVVSSQLVHAEYGGVVPELAARAHMKMIVPVVQSALAEAGAAWPDLSLIAVTSTPGLMGALLVGLPFAKALSFSLGIPFVGVNHLEGHIFAFASSIRNSCRRFSPPCCPAATPNCWSSKTGAAIACSARRSTMPAARRSTRWRSCSACPTRAGSKSRSSARAGTPEHQLPGSRPGRARLQLLRSQDRGALLPARPTRHAAREDVAASFQRAAVEVDHQARRPGGPRRRDCVRSACPAASPPTASCANSSPTSARHHEFKLLVPRLAYCTDNAAMIAAPESNDTPGSGRRRSTSPPPPAPRCPDTRAPAV